MVPSGTIPLEMEVTGRWGVGGGGGQQLHDLQEFLGTCKKKILKTGNYFHLDTADSVLIWLLS